MRSFGLTDSFFDRPHEHPNTKNQRANNADQIPPESHSRADHQQCGQDRHAHQQQNSKDNQLIRELENMEVLANVLNLVHNT